MERGMKRYLEEMTRGFYKFQSRILSEVAGAILLSREIRSFGIARRLSLLSGGEINEHVDVILSFFEQ